MPTYKLTVTFSGSKEIEVEAESEQDARDSLDLDDLDVQRADLDDHEVVDVEEVEA